MRAKSAGLARALLGQHQALPATSHPVRPMLAIGLLAIAANVLALRNGFVWDDAEMVREAVLRDFDGLVDIWLNPDRIKSEGHYWPITWTTLWVDYQLHGKWAPGWHATNIALYALVSIMVGRTLESAGARGAWIARFGRSVAEQVLDAVEGRMQAARQPGAAVTLAGEIIALGPLFGTESGSGGDRHVQAEARREAEAQRGDGGQGPGVAVGPGGGVALRRARGRAHCGRRGGDRHARDRLDAGVRGGRLERRTDRHAQRGRRRLLGSARRRGRRVAVRGKRQGRGGADEPLPLGAPCAHGAAGGLGRGGSGGDGGWFGLSFEATRREARAATARSTG